MKSFDVELDASTKRNHALAYVTNQEASGEEGRKNHNRTRYYGFDSSVLCR